MKKRLNKIQMLVAAQIMRDAASIIGIAGKYYPCPPPLYSCRAIDRCAINRCNRGLEKSMAPVKIGDLYFSTLGIHPEDNTPDTGVFGDPGNIENQNARIISLLLAATILEEKSLRIRRKKRV